MRAAASERPRRPVLMGEQTQGPGGDPHVRRAVAHSLLVSARPKQWVKNLFVLAPLAFAEASGVGPWARSAVTLVAFCLAASGLYLLNDLADRELDREHPLKRDRPITRGDITGATAVVAAVFAFATAIVLASLASWQTLALLVAYIVITLAYSWGLKHVVVLDVMLVASGFVIRVAAGSYAAGFRPSEWLLICTGFLALFLGFGKRRQELVSMGDDASLHRPILEEYSREVLDQFLSAATMGAVLSYSLYTLTSERARQHGALVLTIPFVVFAIFRYQLLVQTREEGGSPEELLLTDRPLQVAILLWGMTAFLVVYWNRFF